MRKIISINKYILVFIHIHLIAWMLSATQGFMPPYYDNHQTGEKDNIQSGDCLR